MNTNHNSIDAIEATQDIYEQMTFGGLIRSLRESDEISQIELAKRIHVSKQFLNDVEHNRKDVGFNFARKIADALGYPLEPLLELLIRDQLRNQKLNYIVELKRAS
jgi:transcriptional regulator with XRE-family HTH domain